MTPDYGYPKPLSNWHETFGGSVAIDAAFQYKNRKTYFFSGTNYYMYDDANNTVSWLKTRRTRKRSQSTSAPRLT